MYTQKSHLCWGATAAAGWLLRLVGGKIYGVSQEKDKYAGAQDTTERKGGGGASQ